MSHTPQHPWNTINRKPNFLRSQLHTSVSLLHAHMGALLPFGATPYSCGVYIPIAVCVDENDWLSAAKGGGGEWSIGLALPTVYGCTVHLHVRVTWGRGSQGSSWTRRDYGIIYTAQVSCECAAWIDCDRAVELESESDRRRWRRYRVGVSNSIFVLSGSATPTPQPWWRQ